MPYLFLNSMVDGCVCAYEIDFILPQASNTEHQQINAIYNISTLFLNIERIKAFFFSMRVSLDFIFGVRFANSFTLRAIKINFR